MFQVYIIYSKSKDRYYTGYTSAGVEKRIERHNSGWSKSTKSGIPWKLKYFRTFETKSEAIKWENYIKRQKSLDFVKGLISSEHNEFEI